MGREEIHRVVDGHLQHFGNGFVFEDYKRETLIKTMQLAMEIYKDKKQFKKLIQKLTNEILVELKKHFEKTDKPASWMNDALDGDEVNAIKKIIHVIRSNAARYDNHILRKACS